MSYGIHYGRYHMILEGYSDWISDANEIYAKSGYVLARCILGVLQLMVSTADKPAKAIYCERKILFHGDEILT
jgi:hypothetical protein